jgi:hypothetical protein
MSLEEDHRKRMERISKEMEGKSTEELREELNRALSTPGMQELILQANQPLVDLGWRVDHERKGISRPGHFIPLADLKAMFKALALSGASEPAVRSPYDPNEYSLAVGDLEKAIWALEPTLRA